MSTETVTIPIEEYAHLKKKEELADDLLLQLQASVQAIKEGRVRRVR